MIKRFGCVLIALFSLTACDCECNGSAYINRLSADTNNTNVPTSLPLIYAGPSNKWATSTVEKSLADLKVTDQCNCDSPLAVKRVPDDGEIGYTSYYQTYDGLMSIVHGHHDRGFYHDLTFPTVLKSGEVRVLSYALPVFFAWKPEKVLHHVIADIDSPTFIGKLYGYEILEDNTIVPFIRNVALSPDMLQYILIDMISTQSRLYNQTIDHLSNMRSIYDNTSEDTAKMIASEAK